MSPLVALWTRGRARFPRVSGDEPWHPHEFAREHSFSPRERG